MITLTKGLTEYIYFTPDSSAEWYWMEFTNRVTQSVVIKKGKSDSDTTRYQKLLVDVDFLFEGEDEGMWSYNVWEWDQNEDLKTGDILESGFMYLYPATEFTPTNYNEQSNSFITYNG